jgi:hypothetical protein
MIMPMMTHQPGVITSVGIDLHLGKSLSLGGGIVEYIIWLLDFYGPDYFRYY